MNGRTKLLTFGIVIAALMISGFPVSQALGVILICYGAGKIAGAIYGRK